MVEIRPVPQSRDRYTILYSPPTAEGTGMWTAHHEPKPRTVFRTITNRTGEAQVNALTVPRQVEIEIEADPSHPTDFRGSKDFIVDEQHDTTAKTYGKPRTSKVKWDLHLCAK